MYVFHTVSPAKCCARDEVGDDLDAQARFTQYVADSLADYLSEMLGIPVSVQDRKGTPWFDLVIDKPLVTEWQRASMEAIVEDAYADVLGV